MKPFKIYISLFLLVFGFACQDDTDRVIQTSLPTEAMQLFDISRTLGESSPLFTYSFSDFESMDSTSLPGFPKIEINSAMRQVTLDFDQSYEAEADPVNNRSGKITISFVNTSNASYRTIIYNNYQLGEAQLSGTRNFKQISLSEFTESFDELVLIFENDMTYPISGEFSHSISRSDFRVQSFTTTGNLSGRNAVGRTIKLTVSSPKLISINCFKSDQILQLEGSETWQVGREENEEVNHTLTFENELDCKVLAFAQLPDGRRLQLNN
ncbi:hypothetical protein [Algoriphagus hitonicola]|uniref:Lipoprotein n=1 Tax=Algoriphagus hitonicola TaxID=435880 RepID=A0A1I2P509_9BACT|nr:hypothetical protein [Algoriphagus hitonicola]SFG08716.1 hypothetical protein SAMN04487988_101362 [Algoriphagus hitonicola]